MTRERYDSLLRELNEEVLTLGALVADTIEACVDSLEHRDAARAQELIEADNQIDRKRYSIENQALLLIATQQPLAGDLRTVVATLTVATELERIGDYCEGIARLILRMAAEPITAPINDIRTMAELTQRLLREVLDAFRTRDVEVAGQVWDRDDEVDALYAEIFRVTLHRMTLDKTTLRSGTYLLWISHNVERMADRVTNIAERVAFVVTGDIAAFRDRRRAQSLPE